MEVIYFYRRCFTDASNLFFNIKLCSEQVLKFVYISSLVIVWQKSSFYKELFIVKKNSQDNNKLNSTECETDALAYS